MFAKKKLKREDFLFQNGWFEELVKTPGELQMQQFQISDCQECSIFLFDAAACVYIDECKHCTVFVGACESSVFVRDCYNLTVVCTSQQFRVRECRNCDFALACDSQPIIESSYDIRIGCFPPVGYAPLGSQMQQCKTNGWNNNWFDVYDFTPQKYNKINYVLESLSGQKLNHFKQKMKNAMKKAGLKEQKCPIPRSLGRLGSEASPVVVIVVFPVPDPSLSGEEPSIQSRIHRINRQQQEGLQIKLQGGESGRTSVLFLKVGLKSLQNWRKKLVGVLKIVQEDKLLELYEGCIFAPFKDQH